MVLDGAGRRCPIGVPGELNVAGVGVGRGYLGQPARTGEVFVVDESIPEGRRYRTGDLARWLADGTVEYLGRLDDQVKIRGNRVTLGEAENALTRCPDVAEAVVLDEDTDAGKRLVAYVVAGGEDRAAGDRPSLVRSIVGQLAERVPGYLVPADLVLLDRLPLTRSGKVDRRTLAASGHREHGSDRPRDAVERELAEVWRDVLGSDAFGIHDDFFTVGGDSILVLRMRTEAERRGLAFDVERFHADPTVAGLAAQVAHGPAPAAEDAVGAPFALVPLIDRPGVEEAGVEDAFPATQLQLGMLFHSLHRADSPLYKDVFRYRLRMPWHADEFRHAYRELVRRQPALRANFDLTGRSVPLQVVLRDVPDPLEIVDAGDADDAGDAGAAAVDAYVERMHRVAYPCSTAGRDGRRPCTGRGCSSGPTASTWCSTSTTRFSTGGAWPPWSASCCGTIWRGSGATGRRSRRSRTRRSCSPSTSAPNAGRGTTGRPGSSGRGRWRAPGPPRSRRYARTSRPSRTGTGR